jgi:ABC-type nitrate/sulfonate/bicarbonate transport system substrate-binding protein
VTTAGAHARVELIVFPGGFNWPVWVARERGFFTRRGVAVELSTTPGSLHQWTALAEGRADLAITLMDNVVAYREGQGASSITVPDAVAVMGLDTRSMPALIAQPGVRSIAELRGARLAVDALETGNALVLMGMLEHGGLPPGTYSLERAGGVAQRFEAILRGEYAASLFNAPLDALLTQRGFRVLDTARSVLARFQGHVLAVRRGWAAQNRASVAALVAGLKDALAWLFEPANRDDALALYDAAMPDAGPGAAAAAYAVLFDRATGFPVDGALDLAGVEGVLQLRRRYGQPPRALREAAAYCDLDFLRDAAALAPAQA